MENLIRNVIEADKEARVRIEKAKSEKYNVKSLINEQRKGIEESYQEAFQHQADDLKKKMDEQLHEEEAAQQAAFDARMSALKESYNTHHEEWVSSIVSNCLEV